MTVIHRIEPPIELDTPRGRADAYFLLDYGSGDNLVWVCFQRETGECWSYKNPVVRKVWCETMGTGKKPELIVCAKCGKPPRTPREGLSRDIWKTSQIFYHWDCL